MFQKKYFSYLVLGAGLFVVSCSSGSSSVSLDSVTESFPEGMAIASPTATASTAGARAGAVLFPGLIVQQVELDAEADFATKKEALDEVLEADTDAACEITLPPLTAMGAPTCYGPQLDYQNHPDGSPSSGQLPGGDLGLWSDEEMDGTACTAAKINQLIASTAAYVDYAMLMSASIVCRMVRASETLPADAGDELDLSEELGDAIEANNPSVTVTTATMEKMDDVTVDEVARDAYKFTLVATATTPSTFTVTAILKHVSTSSDNSTYLGKFAIEFDGLPSSNQKQAIYISYEKASASSLKLKMLSASFPDTETFDDIFDTTGEFIMTSQWDGNISQALMDVNPTTGLGNFSYAWQAGVGDSHARIFNGFTQDGEGCGFFGFGQKFDQAGGTASDNVIDGMICNWAGPGSTHDMVASGTDNLIQKQCMIVNSSTGIFEVDPTRNNITFAPRANCNGGGGLQIKLASEGSYYAAPSTHDLADKDTDVDFADYAAPTAPDLPEDF